MPSRVVAIALLVFAGSRAPAYGHASEETAPTRSKPTTVHVPVHKGSIDLATGLYLQVNDDLVVQGTPALVLRRTYLSGFRGAREFGIGATHAGEDYLTGDWEQFQSASLVLARGSRINFRRTTSGTALPGARYVHHETAGEWQGAELSWTPGGWSLRKRDGSVLGFRGCDNGSVCSIIQSRDPRGQTVRYRRDAFGRLLKMESARRWIAFEYEGDGRIARAYDSAKRFVRYAYDARGRLERVTGSDGTVRKYTYTDLDELETIQEPGTSISNTFEGGRCVRQTNWFPDRNPFVYELTFHVESGIVHRTRISESNGSWREYAWDDRKSAMSELLARAGREPAFVMYEREAASRAIVAFTVSCKNREGRPVRQRIPVRQGEAELLKRALLDKMCAW